jgi:phage recombination protein Bet
MVPIFLWRITMSKNTNQAQPSVYGKFAEKFNFADEQQLISTLKATAFKVKEGEVTDAQMMALLIVADQYGLNPFTKEIFAYPDKQSGIVPVVSVDGWSRIINQHPDMDGLEFVYGDEWIMDQPGAKPCPAWIECVIYRKGRNHPIRIKEFLDEVYRPPFQVTRNNQPFTVNGPWQSHTKRMLRHKALIQCSRVAFGFVGIYDQDEAERIIEGQSEVILPEQEGDPSPQAIKTAERIIQRSQKNGTWAAALEYAKENYRGADLNYILKQINEAKEKASALPNASVDPNPSAAQVQNPSENTQSGPHPSATAQEHLGRMKAATAATN